MAKSKDKPAEPRGAVSLGGWLPPLETDLGRRLVAAGVLLALLVVTGYTAWRHVRSRVVGGEHYRLTLDGLRITPQPPWIRSDVRAEVFRQAGFDAGVSLLDDDLAPRAAKAFELHPWVARVERVVKQPPGGLEISLVYRRPVLMVEIPGGLYAVDAHGVLLPSQDFTTEDVPRYPRLSGVAHATESLVGTPWRDPFVASGAKLAEQLVDDWSTLGLYRLAPLPIDPLAGPSGGPVVAEFELQTRAGSRILWGAAPGAEHPGEPRADAKRARLKRLAAESGSLDRAAAAGPIDLRIPDTVAERAGGAVK